MLEKEALNFILQDMPEGIILAAFCFVFLNRRPRWKELLVIAVLMSLANMVEVLPLAFGIRPLVLMIGYAVVIRIITKKDLSQIFVAVFLLFLLNGVSDLVWGMSILLPITGLSYTHVFNTPYLRALFSYPTLLTVLVVTYFMYRHKQKNGIDFE